MIYNIHSLPWRADSSGRLQQITVSELPFEHIREGDANWITALIMHAVRDATNLGVMAYCPVVPETDRELQELAKNP